MSRRDGALWAGLTQTLGRDWGRDVPVRVTGGVGRLTLGLGGERQGEGGRGAKQVAKLRGERGGESKAREGGERLQKVTLPEWDCGEENPTRGQATRSASRAPGRA